MSNPLLERLKQQTGMETVTQSAPPSIALKQQTSCRHPVKRKKFDPARQPEPEPAYGSDPGLEADYE